MYVHTLRKSFKWLMLPYVFQYYYNRQSNLNKNEVTSNNMLKKNKNYKNKLPEQESWACAQFLLLLSSFSTELASSVRKTKKFLLCYFHERTGKKLLFQNCNYLHIVQLSQDKI